MPFRKAGSCESLIRSAQPPAWPGKVRGSRNPVAPAPQAWSAHFPLPCPLSSPAEGQAA